MQISFEVQPAGNPNSFEPSVLRSVEHIFDFCRKGSRRDINMSLVLSTLSLCIVACELNKWQLAEQCLKKAIESKSISQKYVTDYLEMLDSGGIKLST